MKTSKIDARHQQVMDELCCLLDREAKLNDVEIKEPAKQVHKIQLRAVRDCCGCGCHTMYYEDPDTKEQYASTKAYEMVEAGAAVFHGRRDVE